MGYLPGIGSWDPSLGWFHVFGTCANNSDVPDKSQLYSMPLLSDSTPLAGMYQWTVWAISPWDPTFGNQ